MGTGIGLSMPFQQGDIVDDAEPETGFAAEFVHIYYNFGEKWGAGFQYGFGSGKTGEDPFDNDAFWEQTYFGLTARYTLGELAGFEPYIEGGLGYYQYLIEGDDAEFFSDPVLGAKAALGASYYIGDFYIAPEFCYHYAGYEDGDLKPRYMPEESVDFEADAGMLMFLVKAGVKVWEP